MANYYYMLKINNIYSGPYKLCITSEITTDSSATLEYISVDSYEYSGDGKGIFGGEGDRWQTNRNSGFPHYLIFKSDMLLSKLYIKTGVPSEDGFCAKDFSIYMSDNLLSYQDNKWEEIYKGTFANTTEEQEIILIPTKFLIQQNNNIYSIKKDSFLNLGNKTLSKELFEQYGIDDINDLCISRNTNYIQQDNSTTIGNGKMFEISLNNDIKIKNINDIDIE